MKTLIIAALSSFVFLLPSHGPTREGDPIGSFKPRLAMMEPISLPIPAAQQALQPIPVPVTLSPSSPAQNASAGCVSGYYTGDYYLDNIIRYESGGNSCATNYLGCFGLLQACPGAPLRDACGGNPACQIQWFIDNKTGGRTWAQVWQHELDFGWW